MNAQPVNRSSQLSPLSREHKEGLLFISRVREYLDRINLGRVKNYVLWYWKNHIRTHFFQEERILLPHLATGHPMAKRLKEEHDDIRDLILTLDQDPDKKTIFSLCNLIQLHIHFEEMELYPYLESNLRKEELDKILKELDAHPVGSLEWEDPFWGS